LEELVGSGRHRDERRKVVGLDYGHAGHGIDSGYGHLQHDADISIAPTVITIA